MAATRRPGLRMLTRGRIGLLAIVAVAVAVLAIVIATTGDGDDDATNTASPTAPVLSVELTAADGSSVALGEIVKGTPAVVNFFASWCGPCVREMPDFQAVHARRGGEVTFVGVNLQDSVDAMTSLVEQTGVEYRIVRDESGELFRALEAFSMPTTVFLDADGTVVDVHGGELSRRALDERIDRLLAA